MAGLGQHATGHRPRQPRPDDHHLASRRGLLADHTAEEGHHHLVEGSCMFNHQSVCRTRDHDQLGPRDALGQLLAVASEA